MKTVIQSAPGVQTVVALEDGNLITGMVQDCAPIREFAQAAHREGRHGTSDVKHAAKLPMWAVEKYCHINGIEFSEFMHNREHIRAMCNDPALKDFRIWPGAL